MVNEDGLVGFCFRMAYVWSYATSVEFAADVSKTPQGGGDGGNTFAGYLCVHDMFHWLKNDTPWCPRH
jgi:hypothetical protein